jgi:hypothetical protein
MARVFAMCPEDWIHTDNVLTEDVGGRNSGTSMIGDGQRNRLYPETSTSSKADQKFRGLLRSVSEIEFCTLYVVWAAHCGSCTQRTISPTHWPSVHETLKTL